MNTRTYTIVSQSEPLRRLKARCSITCALSWPISHRLCNPYSRFSRAYPPSRHSPDRYSSASVRAHVLYYIRVQDRRLTSRHRPVHYIYVYRTSNKFINMMTHRRARGRANNATWARRRVASTPTHRMFADISRYIVHLREHQHGKFAWPDSMPRPVARSLTRPVNRSR